MVKKQNGGPRPGAGRKAADGAKDLVRACLMLTPAQQAKVRERGGAVWVRKLIESAK